jgi:CRP-like cAMP-binding protein
MNEDGKEYITNLYHAGDYLGPYNAVENKNYDDTAEILEDAEIYLIPKDDFILSVYHDMNIATKFIKTDLKRCERKRGKAITTRL